MFVLLEVTVSLSVILILILTLRLYSLSLSSEFCTTTSLDAERCSINKTQYYSCSVFSIVPVKLLNCKVFMMHLQHNGYNIGTVL